MARFKASGLSGATDTSDRRLFIRCDCIAVLSARAAEAAAAKPALAGPGGHFSPSNLGRGGRRIYDFGPRVPRDTEFNHRVVRVQGNGGAHLLERERSW